MVCLDNTSHYYDIVVLINLFAYFGVFLPNFGRLASLLYGLNFGVLSIAVLQALVPSAVPDNQLAYVSLNVTAFSLFSLLSNAIGSVSLILGTLLLLGPLAITGREHLHHYFSAQLGLNLSDGALIAVVTTLGLALTLAYSAAERNKAVQIICLSVLYSLLAVFGAKVLFIEYIFQRDDADDKQRILCCGGDYPNKTCPFVLDLWFGLALALAPIIRLYLARKWHVRSRKVDKVEPPPPPPPQAEDDDEIDPESQALLGHNTQASQQRAATLASGPRHASAAAAAAAATNESRFASRYLPASRWQ